MAVTAGVLSLVSKTATTVVASSTAPTAGVGPYTEAWYISTTSGFSPGGGTLVAGLSGLGPNTISGLIPGTQYYVKVVYTDTGDSNLTATSEQLAVSTGFASLNPNSFAQVPYLGQIDLRFNYDTVAGQIDASNVTPMSAGAAVKLVPQSGSNTTPRLVYCTADSDRVFGFINFDIKTVQYVAGNVCEVSLAGNVIYLYAVEAITQGSEVVLNLSTMGGVSAATGSSGKSIVGWAYDGASAAGQLIRVKLQLPSFSLDS